MGMSVVQSTDFYFSHLKPFLNRTCIWNGNLDKANPGDISTDYRTGMLNAINYYRHMAGLQPVVSNSRLNALCQETCMVMAANNYLSHTLPTGLALWTPNAAKTAPVSSISFNFIGAEAIRNFIDDPGFINTSLGHRRDILDPELSIIGIGCIPTSTYLGKPTKPTCCIHTNGAMGFAPSNWSWPPSGACPSPVTFYRWNYCMPGAWFGNSKVKVCLKDTCKIYNPIKVGYSTKGSYINWSVDMTFPPPQEEIYLVEITNVILRPRLEDNKVIGEESSIMYSVQRHNL